MTYDEFNKRKTDFVVMTNPRRLSKQLEPKIEWLRNPNFYFSFFSFLEPDAPPVLQQNSAQKSYREHMSKCRAPREARDFELR